MQKNKKKKKTAAEAPKDPRVDAMAEMMARIKSGQVLLKHSDPQKVVYLFVCLLIYLFVYCLFVCLFVCLFIVCACVYVCWLLLILYMNIFSQKPGEADKSAMNQLATTLVRITVQR